MSVTGRVVNGVIVLPPGTVLPEGTEVRVEMLGQTGSTRNERNHDDEYDDDEYDFEPPLSTAETEELRKVKTGKPLNEILARLGFS
jgi:hypothetical protein